MHPTANPTIILMFLRKGEPNISVSTMLMKDKNPRPINSGEPQGKGLGARVVGQRAKIPVGAVSQLLAPPPQLGTPELPTRAAPINTTTVPASVDWDYIPNPKTWHVPVTKGGKTRLRMRGGTNARNISRKEHMRDVPFIYKNELQNTMLVLI